MYYTFNGDFNDYSGNANHLTNIDTTSVFTTGRFGNANGAFKPGNQIKSQNPLSLSGNQSFSFSLWIKTEPVDISGANVGFFGTGPSSSVADSLGFGLWSLYNNSLYIYGNNADLFAPTGDNNLFHSWRHIIYVYSGSLSNSSVYLDGVQLLFTNHPTGADVRDLVPSQLEFGSTSPNPPDTYLTDFMIYNRSLSPTEVTDLYNAQSVPEPSTYALLLLSGAASLWALKRRKSSVTKPSKHKADSFC